MGLLQLLFKKKPTNSSAIDKHLSQSGNVFMMLFGAVGMVGVIGASTMTVMKGPVKTMSEVTKRTVAENNMIAAGKLALVSAASNDCDSDGVAEPFPYVTATGSISGGGGIPANIGVAKQDPWGTDYAYCTWDHGDALAADPSDNDGNCGASTNYRAGADGGTEYVLAIISAGPDRMFNTTCADVPASPVLNKTSGSDDLVLGYTLAEAGSIAGGLWLDDGSGGAEISRNLFVTDGTTDTFTVDAATGSIAALGTGATGTFPIVRSDNLQSYTGAGGTITVDSALSSTSAITTTGALTGGATNVDSLDAGSGAITTTGTLNAGTSTLGSTTVSSLSAGSGAISTTGTLNAGTSILGGTTVNSLGVTNGATVGGTFDVNGNVTLGDDAADTFDVTGISTLTGPLTVTGLSTMADIDATTLDATGAVTVGSLDAGSGAITTTGTLNAGVTTLGATTLSGELAMGANAITGLANPTASDTDHAATVQYVNDRVASGTGFTETDPQVGDISTSGKWCQTDGDSVECTFDLPGETDPQVGTLTNGRWCITDGTTINCTENTPTGFPTGCTSGQVAQYNGATWVCSSSTPDTLSGLSCTSGQVAQYNGSAWVCAAAGGSGTTISDLTCTGDEIVKWDGANWVCSADIGFVDFTGNLTFNENTIIPGNWSQVGNGLSVPGNQFLLGVMNSTTVAVYNNNLDTLTTFSWNGTDWSIVGNALTLTGRYADALTIMDGNKVVIFDSNTTTDRLYTYQWDGTDWSQVGGTTFISGGPNPTEVTITALDSSTIAFLEETVGRLATYSWNGTSWTRIGNILNIAGFTDWSDIERLDNNTIAMLHSNNTLRTYSWDGTDWSQVGNSLAVPFNQWSASIAALNSTTVVYFNDNTDEFLTYTWDGTNWSAAGTPLSIGGNTAYPSIGALDINTLAFISTGTNELRTYHNDGTTGAATIADAGATDQLGALFAENNLIRVSGTTLNDGLHTISSVIDNNTLEMGTALSSEGPLNANITLVDSAGADPLSALSCAVNEVAQWDGSAWVCASIADSDTLAGLSCSNDEVAQFDGSNWICASVASSDTLNGLSCASGQVAKWNGASWACDDDNNDGSELPGGGAVVEDRNYTLTFTEADPLTAIQGSETKLIGDAASNKLGEFIARDGNTMVSSHGTEVRVFVKSGSSWIVEQTISYGSTVEAVDISGDRIVIGGSNKAEVYARSGSTWSLEGNLPGNTSGGGYGDDVAIDGNYAAVANRYYSPNGIVYIFFWNGSSWVEQQTITETGGYIGEYMDLSGDMLAIGDGGYGSAGRVLTYKRSGTTWVFAGGVAGSASYAGGFGVSLDGFTLAFGEYTGTFGRQIQIYTYNGTTWSQQHTITGLNNFFTGTGLEVKGDRLIYGRLNSRAYIYDRVGSTWSETLNITGSDTVGDLFGTSVTFEGDEIHIGAPDDDDNGTSSGSIYSFDLAATGAKARITDVGAAGNFANFLPIGTAFEIAGTASNDGTYATHSVVDLNTIQVSQSVTNENSVSATVSKTTVTVSEPGDTLAGLSCADGEIAVWNNGGGVWECGAGGGADTLAGLSCSANEVAQWDGSAWVCASVAGSDTLNGLSCANGQVAKWNGSAWVCADDDNDGSSLPGGGTVIDTENYNLTFVPASSQANTQSTELYIPPPSGTSGTHRFGKSAHINGDLAIVGEPDRNRVRIFRKDGGGVWSIEQTLDGESNPNGHANTFGNSVYIDGNTAIVGRYSYENSSSSNVDFAEGKAYIYFFDGSSWSLQQGIEGGYTQQWGHSVAVVGDTAFIGRDDGNVMVYTRSGTTWSSAQTINTGDGANIGLGSESVAVSGDTVALYGGGAVYVYKDNGSSWAFEGKLLPSDTANFSGGSVDINGDTIIVGSSGDGVNNQGAAYVFTRSGTVWSEQAKLTALSRVTFGYFGDSVGIFGDTVVIGEPGRNNDRGRTYIFTRSGGSWSYEMQLTASNQDDDDNYGESVALYGTDIFIGAPNRSTFMTIERFHGAGYFYSLGSGALGQIIDADSNGTLANFLPTGTGFEISGTASNNGAFSTAGIVNANTINVTQSLTSETNVAATIDKTTVNIVEPGTLSSLSCASGEVAQYDGSDWVCASVASSDTLNGLSCASGQVAEWDGSAWVCAGNADTDTLASLSCSANEIAQWDGSMWICSASAGGDNLGDHTATQNLDMGNFKVDNVEGVIFNAVTGAAPLGGGGGIQTGIATIAVEGNACSDIGKLARTTAGDLLVCEDATPITDESCSGFTAGALSFDSGGELHVCMN